MNEQELQDLHKLVWDFRAVAGEYWPTPEPKDALEYAFTEAGEAIDAGLRERRLGDKRNREKETDRLDEWADCAIMLMTALPDYGDVWRRTGRTDDATICLRVAEHMYSSGFMSVRRQQDVATTITMISNIEGMELRARIVGRLQRIMHKHLPFQLWPEGQALLDVHKVFDPSKV